METAIVKTESNYVLVVKIDEHGFSINFDASAVDLNNLKIQIEQALEAERGTI
jgi:hypothetical protein